MVTVRTFFDAYLIKELEKKKRIFTENIHFINGSEKQFEIC